MSALQAQILRLIDSLDQAVTNIVTQKLWIVQVVIAAHWCFFIIGLARLNIMGFTHDHILVQNDFSSFYIASKLALSNHASDVYQKGAHYLAQQIEWGEDAPYFAFFYPPLFLLLCWPLALMPYSGSLILWSALGSALWYQLVRLYQHTHLDVWVFMLAPAVWISIFSGQNSLFIAALMGAGLFWYRTHPWRAGLCFGVMLFKPHFTIMLPFLLVATQSWMVIIAASCTCAVFAGLATWAFGASIWLSYFDAMGASMQALSQGLIGDEKLQSFFAFGRLLGLPVTVSYTLQFFIAAYVIYQIWITARRVPDHSGLGPLAVVGTLVSTPFLLRYDLALLIVPLIWLYQKGRDHGFRRGEVSLAALAYMLPLIPLELTAMSHILLAPMVHLALFDRIRHRLWQDEMAA